MRGEVRRALQFDGAGTFAQINASPSLDVGASSGFTIDAWIKPSDISTPRALFEWNNDACVAGSGACFGPHLFLSLHSPLQGPGPTVVPGSLYANIVGIGPSYSIFSSKPGVIIENAWQHVALTYDQGTGNARLYRNGTVVAEQFFPGIRSQTTYDLYVGARVSSPSAEPPFYYAGAVDELELFNRSLSEGEIKAVYAAAKKGHCRGGCPLGLGYWKEHPEAWPVESIVLGLQAYNASKLESLLRTPVHRDASMELAHQVIAATLNVAHGAPEPRLASNGRYLAQNLLAEFKGELPYDVSSSSAVGQQMIALAKILELYNAGSLTPDCRRNGDDDTEERDPAQ